MNTRGDLLALGAMPQSTTHFAATVISAGGVPVTSPLTPQPDRRDDSLPVGILGDISPTGDVVVAWIGGGLIRVAARDAVTGTWTPTAAVGGANPTLRAVAVSSGGGATVIWTETTAAGHAFLSSRLEPGTNAWGAPQDVRSIRPVPPAQVELAVDDAGRATAVWSDGSEVASAVHEPGSGAWAADDTDGRGARGVGPSLAVNRGGKAIVAWIAPTGADGPSFATHVRRRSPGGAWGPVEIVSARTTETAGFPDVAIADDGSTIVGWWRMTRTRTLYQEPIAQAAVARDGQPWGPPMDLTQSRGLEFHYEIVVAIHDAQNAAAAWTTADGGGAAYIPWFAAFNPSAAPRVPIAPKALFFFDRRATVMAYSVVELFFATSRSTRPFIEELPPVLVERRVGRRWVLVRRTSRLSSPRVKVRIGGPGRYEFRIRLVGTKLRSNPIVITALPGRRPIGTPCLTTNQAVAAGRQAALLCEREDLSVVVRRVDIPSGLPVGPDVPVGSSAFGDLQEFPPQIADDGRTIWVLRDTTVLPIDRRSGRPGPAIKVDDTGLSAGRRIAAGPSGVALLDPNTDTLIRIDHRTRTVASRITLPTDADLDEGSLAVGRTGVWISRASTSSNAGYHLHVGADDIPRRVPGQGGLHAGPLGVWELGPRGARRVDPPSSKPVADIRGLRLSDLVVGPNTLWGISDRQPRDQSKPVKTIIFRISPATGRAVGRPVETVSPSTLLPAPGGLWSAEPSGIFRLR